MNSETTTHKIYDWPWFGNHMYECGLTSESQCRPLLDLIGECDAIVGAIVRREMSYASERPQDYVVPTLAVRAFRLAISSIRLALSGYADSTPNLDRTIFEIGIRLLDISQDPIAASLGYLMQGSTEAISTMTVELQYRREKCLATHNLLPNLKAEEKYLDTLRNLAIERGFDPEQIRKRHGKLNVREVCKRFGIEKAYLVDFAYDSSHVHEKNVATSHFYSESLDSRNFELGPIPAAIPHAVADTLTNLSRVLQFSAAILEDDALLKRSRKLVHALHLRMRQVGLGETQPTGHKGQ